MRVVVRLNPVLCGDLDAVGWLDVAPAREERVAMVDKELSILCGNAAFWDMIDGYCIKRDLVSMGQLCKEITSGIQMVLAARDAERDSLKVFREMQGIGNISPQLLVVLELLDDFGRINAEQGYSYQYCAKVDVMSMRKHTLRVKLEKMEIGKEEFWKVICYHEKDGNVRHSGRQRNNHMVQEKDSNSVSNRRFC